MSKQQKAARKASIQSQIDNLRAQNTAKRQQLQAANKAANTQLREDHKEYASNTRAEYDQKYEDELEKMKQDRSFKKVSKKKK